MELLPQVAACLKTSPMSFKLRWKQNLPPSCACLRCKGDRAVATNTALARLVSSSS